MRKLLIRIGGVAAVLLGIFLAAELAGVPFLRDPTPWLKENRHIAATVSFGLLASDVVLPLPSSLLMMANGALFGLAPGAFLSFSGSLACAVCGFWLGRQGATLAVTDESSRQWLERWGALAVAASRPVPLLAESISIVAGTTPMRWSTLLWSSAAGSAPASLIYAWAGARASQSVHVAIVFGLTLAVSGVLWWIGYRGSRAPEL